MLPLCLVLGVAFLPGIHGGAVSPRWAILSLAIPLMVHPVHVGLGHIVVLLLLLW